MAKKDFKATLAARFHPDRDIFFGTSKDIPQVIEVDVDRLEPNPDQPRQAFDEEALRELAASIAEHGLQQPIQVERHPDKEGNYVIVSGERRWRAHQLLGRQTIFAVLTSGNRRVKAIIENLQREDLRPLELAQSLADLKAETGFTDEELGKTIGKKRGFVTEVLRLTTLPEGIRRECRTSDIPKSTLLEVARIDDPDEQVRRWSEIKGGNATVRTIRAAKKGLIDNVTESSAERTLAAGRSFVRQLREISRNLNEETEFRKELREIQQQINEVLREVPGDASAPTHQ